MCPIMCRRKITRCERWGVILSDWLTLWLTIINNNYAICHPLDGHIILHIPSGELSSWLFCQWGSHTLRFISFWIRKEMALSWFSIYDDKLVWLLTPTCLSSAFRLHEHSPSPIYTDLMIRQNGKHYKPNGGGKCWRAWLLFFHTHLVLTLHFPGIKPSTGWSGSWRRRVQNTTNTHQRNYGIMSNGHT